MADIWRCNMIKVVAFVRKRPDLSREEFIKRWTGDHTKLSKVLGASPYRINIAAEAQHLEGGLPYDGTAEMYWPDRMAFEAALASREGKLAGEDVANFASSVELVVMEEWLVQ